MIQTGVRAGPFQIGLGLALIQALVLHLLLGKLLPIRDLVLQHDI